MRSWPAPGSKRSRATPLPLIDPRPSHAPLQRRVSSRQRSRWLAPALLGTLLSAWLGLVALPATADTPHHTLWSLKGRTNTVYLLGSMHFLRSSETLPQAVDEAYQEAKTLVMEIDMDDLDPQAAPQLAQELGLLPAGSTLELELGADAYHQVSAEARSVGLDPQLLNRFRPWLAALTLTQLRLAKLGLDPHAGVEQQLTARAGKDHKEILGLETLRQQLSLLANLPMPQQREFLLYSVEDTERASQEIDEMITAWRTGDTEALAKLLTEGLEQYPDLYRPLTTERNLRWIPRIENLLDDRDDYLVVVGALHLVGKDSVIELLRRKGHEVTQH